MGLHKGEEGLNQIEGGWVPLEWIERDLCAKKGYVKRCLGVPRVGWLEVVLLKSTAN